MEMTLFKREIFESPLPESHIEGASVNNAKLIGQGSEKSNSLATRRSALRSFKHQARVQLWGHSSTMRADTGIATCLIFLFLIQGSLAIPHSNCRTGRLCAKNYPCCNGMSCVRHNWANWGYCKAQQKCMHAGGECTEGSTKCCQGLSCQSMFNAITFSRTGICKPNRDEPVEPQCTMIGRRCIPGRCCKGLVCQDIPGSRTGVCEAKPIKPKCTVDGGRCIPGRCCNWIDVPECPRFEDGSMQADPYQTGVYCEWRRLRSWTML